MYMLTDTGRLAHSLEATASSSHTLMTGIGPTVVEGVPMQGLAKVKLWLASSPRGPSLADCLVPSD